jgi:hypothetical protein
MRSLSSAAAFSVNVKAIREAGSAPSAMSEATLREIDSVFPEPAQAITWSGEPRWLTTSCCGGERVTPIA